MAAESGGAGSGGAIALVPKLDGGGDGGALGVVEEAVNGVMAGSGAGGVDGGVAEAVALGDDEATRGARVEGGGEAGDVEAGAVLAGGDEFVVDNGGGG